MNRRIVGVLVALLSLLLFAAFLYSNGLSRSFSGYYVSDDEWAKIIESRNENPELDTSCLKFNGYSLEYASGKAYYSIVDNDWHNYDPVVSLSRNRKLAARGERISAESIENNKSVELLIYNNKEYRRLELVTTTLPIMSMTFDELPATRENETFHMRLFDNRRNTINRVISSDGQAHRRGASSFGLEKGNLTLKLTQRSVGENTRSNPQSLLGMPESDSWVLSSMYFDYEKVRDAFAQTMWSKMNQNSFDVKNSFEVRYVELFVNGEYYGLYLLGSKPSPDNITSEIVDEEHPDIMYKLEDNDNITGYVTDQISTLRNFKQETRVGEKEANKVLHDYFTAVMGADIGKIEDVTDMTNAVDFHLFVNITQNGDIPRGLEGYKNAYISFKWDGEKYKVIFAPWDFDIALGSSTLYKEYYNMKPSDNIILGIDSVSAIRRNGSDLADRQIQKRFNELRQGTFSDLKVNEVIDSLQSDIFSSGAFLRDLERWPNSNHSDPKITLDDFRTHVIQRLHYLDSYYSYSNDDFLKEKYVEIPNYVTEYLETGILLSPDDPNYETKQEEVEVELYEEDPTEFLFW